MYEVEVKSRLVDRKAVFEKLLSLGCQFGEELYQIDHIFLPKGTAFPPPYSVPVLRVRKQNSRSIFTLKISQTSRQDCIEREFEIADADKMIEVLQFIGYEDVQIVERRRIKTKLQDIEIVLDDVLNLGEFIEAEKVVTDENHTNRQQTQAELLDILESIGVKREDQIINGKYDIMLNEKRLGIPPRNDYSDA